MNIHPLPSFPDCEMALDFYFVVLECIFFSFKYLKQCWFFKGLFVILCWILCWFQPINFFLLVDSTSPSNSEWFSECVIKKHRYSNKGRCRGIWAVYCKSWTERVNSLSIPCNTNYTCQERPTSCHVKKSKIYCFASIISLYVSWMQMM